jgi:nitrate reductase NapE component
MNPEPSEPVIPPVAPPIASEQPPTTVLPGMTVIQPTTENIVLDPLPVRPVPVPPVGTPTSASPTPVGIPTFTQHVMTDSEVRAAGMRRRNSVVNFIIIIIGILFIASVAISLALTFATNNTTTPPTQTNLSLTTVIGYAIDVFIGFTLIFRIDMLRRFIMVLLIIGVVLSVYGIFIATALLSAYTVV